MGAVKYDIIYGDFPWSGYTPCGTARLPYEIMSEDEINSTRGRSPNSALFARKRVDGWHGHGDQYPGTAVL